MMRNVFLALLLCSFYSFSQANMIFKDRNYFEAQNEAKEKNKPLVIMFYANWCEHCKKMKSNILQDTDVVLTYGQNYITLAVDAESEAGNMLKNKFGKLFKVRSYPTFAFMSNEEVYFGGFSGEMKKENFIDEGNRLLQADNQYDAIKAAFNSDPSNAEKCLKLITAVRKAGFDATEVTQKYLKTQSSDGLFTELNWRVMANGINTLEAPEFQFILDHQAEFGKAASPQRVEKKIIFMVQDNLRAYVDASDTLNYFKRRPYAEKIHLRKTDSLLFKYDSQIYANVHNWKQYQKVTLNQTDTYLSKDANQLLDIASNYLNYITEPVALQKALTWTQQSIALSENAEKHLVAAKLYLKLKDKNKALEEAQKAKNWSANMGWSTSESDKIIQEINALKK